MSNDSTSHSALRVVLGVTEVSAVAEMDSLRKNTEALMKAYHFQQTMRTYACAVLTYINTKFWGDMEPLTREEFLALPEPEAPYHGPQYLVNILDPRPYDDTRNDVMAFVEPTLNEEDSYLVNGSPLGPLIIPLADLNTLANFLVDNPDVYDAFLNVAAFQFHVPTDGEPDCNIPKNGIVCV